MTTASIPATSLRSVLAWTGAIGLIWIVVAIIRPDTTLHLGPIFLPLLPAFLLRGRHEGSRGLAAGTVMGAGVIVLLTASGNMNGPAIHPFGSALTESLVFLLAAAVGGLAILKWQPAEG